MNTTAEPTTSVRKPFNHLAGYKASRKNPLTNIHVVIYESEPAGMDATQGRYMVSCEAHNQTEYTTSMPKARELMKEPARFCTDCREIAEGPEQYEAGPICGDRSETW